ncbi:MAG: hypothetical protein J0G30_02375 [Actinomycetales bacterium]|nr:hypothetical protein [Actinomycetales bacterium]
MTPTRDLDIDASATSAFRPHRAAGGVPGPVAAFPDFPDMTPLWREAGLTAVRSYDWVSRLDTRDNPESLFPDWSADPTDPASYNFAATDDWVDAVHGIGAEVLFTIASSIPQNKLPALDVETYGIVVEHVVRHYATGWANGPATPVRRFEFGDQPDLGPLHFDGPAQAFSDMYEAFVAAVERVDPSLEVGGPSLAFPLNADAPLREGFLGFVRDRGLRLDFFSFLWFADPSRDPLDAPFVAAELRKLLDEFGFTETRLVLSYWNYLGIPSNTAPAPEKAAFQAAAAIALQDSVVDEAFFFRADSGKDPHYGFIDPAGLYADGAPDERAAAFALIGRAQSGQRLAARGGDESGFACLAGREGDVVRILLANFVAPASALEPRESDEFRFTIPIGQQRIDLGFRLPPQRSELASAGVDAAHLTVRNLPAGRTVVVTREGLDGRVESLGDRTVSEAGDLVLDLAIAPQSVALLELTVHGAAHPLA